MSPNRSGSGLSSFEEVSPARTLSSTYEEVDGRIIRTDGGVYLQKNAGNGPSRRRLIMQDTALYELLSGAPVDQQVRGSHAMLHVSSRCNLTCPMCYETGKPEDELSLAEIRGIVSGYRGKHVTLAGREPTMREDLCDIIRVVEERNHSVLLTNGLRLADSRFVSELQRAGLSIVTLSFNGFSEASYTEVNGGALLEQKLQALDNLRQAGLPTVLSATIVRGVNEDQIRPLFDYCLEHKFIVELRLRSHTPVGHHLGIEQLTLSELLDLICLATTMDRREIHWEVEALARYFELTGFEYVRPKTCSLVFSVVRRGGRILPTGHGLLPLQKIPASAADLLFFVRFVRDSMRYYRFGGLAPLLRRGRSRSTLRVTLKSWPNLDTLDLKENMKCNTMYYRHGAAQPFCLANILGGRSTDRAECARADASVSRSS